MSDFLRYLFLFRINRNDLFLLDKTLVLATDPKSA